MNKSTFVDLLIILFVVIFSTLLIWAPFILQASSFWGLKYPSGGMEIIWRNFDGLNYIAVAKSFYNPNILKDQFSSLGLSPIYFSSHFPLYPLSITLLSPFFGYLNGMLISTVIFTILAAWMFYLLVKEYKLSTDPLFLSIVFLFLPARWIVVRSVGSNESLFIFLILLAFYTLKKGWFLPSAITSALAGLTRSPAAILFASITITVFGSWFMSIFKPPAKKIPLQVLTFVIVPLAVLALFYFYKISYNDFFAYFHSGDNIHLKFLPWSVFNSGEYWVGTFWLENIIYIYILLLGATLILWKKKLYDFAAFTGLYFVASSLVAHLDIARYTLPAFPFVLIAFENFITTREFKIVFLILLIPIYLFTQNFLIGNISPVVNFGPFR